jgi:hypothetical protein
MKTPELQGYTEKQNGIFNNFRAAQAEIPQKGVEVDPGTALQSGFIVAWRLPERVAREVADYSLQLHDVIDAVPYGLNNEKGIDNVHITLSDYNLTKGEVIDPNTDEAQAALSGLTVAVRKGIDRAGGLRQVAGSLVVMEDALHNGKTAVFAGQPNQQLFEVRNAVIDEAAAEGITLKGAWGAHSTLSRVREAHGPESPAVRHLVDLLAEAPHFGEVQPSSLDVGYFVADPVQENGFAFHTIERFDIPKDPQIFTGA